MLFCCLWLFCRCSWILEVYGGSDCWCPAEQQKATKKYPSNCSSSVLSVCSTTIWLAGFDHKHCQHLINTLQHLFQSELHMKWRLHPSHLELFCVRLPPFDLISIIQTPPISCRAHLTMPKRHRLGFVFCKLCTFWSVAIRSYFLGLSMYGCGTSPALKIIDLLTHLYSPSTMAGDLYMCLFFCWQNPLCQGLRWQGA